MIVQGFESPLPNKHIVVEESGLSRHIWDVEHVGSNPTYYTVHGLGSLMVEHQFVALKGASSSLVLDPTYMVAIV